MTGSNSETTSWLRRVSEHSVHEADDVHDYLLTQLQRYAEAGISPLPAGVFEESRSLNLVRFHMPRVGIVFDDAGDDDDDDIVRMRAELEAALQEQGVSTETAVHTFFTGIGAGAAVVIIGAIAGVVSILKNGPDAWENSKMAVRKVLAALKKLVASTGSSHCELNVESLKLVCVGAILDEYPQLESLEPRLISAAMATDPDPETREDDVLGPIHILVPLPQMGMTHVFAVDWHGQILARSTIPYTGPSTDELEGRRELRAGQEEQ